MKVLLHAITILIIELGIFAWYQLADFNNPIWISFYYIWDKSVVILLVLCCINPCKTLIPFWVIIGMFFVIRLLCEFVGVFYNIGKFLSDYHIMFLIDLLCITLVLTNQMKKWQQLNS